MFNREILSLRSHFVAVLACLAALVAPGVAGAVTLPAGFQQTTVYHRPRVPDGHRGGSERACVRRREERDREDVHESLGPDPEIAADLRTQVHNFSARGLMSVALDPNYPTQPYIYVYYTLDAKIGGTPPLYGDADGTWDNCAKANLGLAENCVAGGRISRIRLEQPGRGSAASRCSSRTGASSTRCTRGGGLSFGADGYLYFSAGDGSTASFWDYGQTGTPPNPCGDPPGTIGSLLTTPTSEGGRLRVQDLRTLRGPHGSRRHADPDRPAHRRGRPGQPAVQQRRRERAPHPGLRSARRGAAR